MKLSTICVIDTKNPITWKFQAIKAIREAAKISAMVSAELLLSGSKRCSLMAAERYKHRDELADWAQRWLYDR